MQLLICSRHPSVTLNHQGGYVNPEVIGVETCPKCIAEAIGSSCEDPQLIEINLEALYTEVAKIEELSAYVQTALTIAKEGRTVILTGKGPIWLYLAIAHALHGKILRLFYNSPVTGKVEIFNHNPY